MGWSHVRDQWPENVSVYAFADCEDDRNAGEETGRSELRVDERRWQHSEQADRKSALVAAKACVRRIRATTRAAGICAMTMKDVLTRTRIPIAAGPSVVWAF